LLISTEDGSAGLKGRVTDILKELVVGEEKAIQKVFACGPVPMMKAVADVTRAANISTIVSLNPLMLDATGMCGVCRVTVGGKVKFACVEGPEFDGHLVDFQELSQRLKTFRAEEGKAREIHECKLKKL
jgi:ferredoxin--NADP+ reductase